MRVGGRGRTTPRRGCTRFSTGDGCRSAKPGRRWECRTTACDTQRRRGRCCCAGMARVSLSCGLRRRPTWIRGRRVSNSLGGTFTSLVLPRPRRSPAGPGSGGAEASAAFSGLASALTAVAPRPGLAVPYVASRGGDFRMSGAARPEVAGERITHPHAFAPLGWRSRRRLEQRS